jgi:hypothetical protein
VQEGGDRWSYLQVGDGKRVGKVEEWASAKGSRKTGMGTMQIVVGGSRDRVWSLSRSQQ